MCVSLVVIFLLPHLWTEYCPSASAHRTPGYRLSTTPALRRTQYHPFSPVSDRISCCTKTDTVLQAALPV